MPRIVCNLQERQVALCRLKLQSDLNRLFYQIVYRIGSSHPPSHRTRSWHFKEIPRIVCACNWHRLPEIAYSSASSFGAGLACDNVKTGEHTSRSLGAVNLTTQSSCTNHFHVHWCPVPLHSLQPTAPMIQKHTNTINYLLGCPMDTCTVHART